MSNKAPNSSTPLLYSFRRCPYAMRARMGLITAGINVEIREIVLRDKPAHMLEASPKGTVPVLLLPDERVIDESLDIMLWALEQNDPQNWLSADGWETLVTHNDTTFKAALDRYKYPTRYPEEDCTNAREKGLETLESLNSLLQKHAFLCGESPSLADFAIFPFIRQFAHVDREWFYALPLPALQSWLTNHLDSDLFQKTMQKRTPWKEGDPPTFII